MQYREREMAMQNEKRNNPRWPVTFNVVFDDEESFQCGSTIDISPAGILVEAETAVEEGTPLKLIPLKNTEELPYEFNGKVARVVQNTDGESKYRIGIELLLLPHEITALREIICN